MNKFTWRQKFAKKNNLDKNRIIYFAFALLFLHCAIASCAVYCNRSWLCVCVFVAGGRAVSVTTITRNCVHRSSPNWACIGAGSDHLQPIKFWRSCAPGKGVCGGGGFWLCLILQPSQTLCVYGWLRQGEFFSLRLTTYTNAQCLRLSGRFFIIIIIIIMIIIIIIHADETMTSVSK